MPEFPFLKEAFQWAISRTNLPSRNDMFHEDVLEAYEGDEDVLCESDDEGMEAKIRPNISSNFVILPEIQPNYFKIVENYSL